MPRQATISAAMIRIRIQDTPMTGLIGEINEIRLVFNLCLLYQNN